MEEEPRPGRVAEGEVGDDVADAERRVVQLHAADVAQRAHLARVLVLQHVPVAQELQVEEGEACSSDNISMICVCGKYHDGRKRVSNWCISAHTIEGFSFPVW